MRRILLFVFIVILSGSSLGWCGTGSYIDSPAGTPDELQLKVYFERRNADPKPWEPLFQAASRLFFNATEKQVKISRVTFYIGCPEAADQADVRIAGGGDGAFTSQKGGLGHQGPAIYLSQIHKTIDDPKNRGHFGLVHELGHYLFALLEEYKDENGAASSCVSSPPASLGKTASLMDGGTTIEGKNERTEFCVKENHNKGRTEQDTPRSIGGKDFVDTDDWTWIQAWMSYRYGISLKVPEPEHLPVSDPSGFGADPEFQEVDCRLRAAVGIDRSGSMSTPPAVQNEAGRAVPGARSAPIDAVKEGADTFIRLLRDEDTAGLVQVGEEAGVLSLRAMDANGKARFLAELPTIEAGGRADWSEALEGSFTEIAGAREEERSAAPAGHEVILLLSDGREGQDEEAAMSENLLSSIQRRGVVVYAVGFGEEHAAALRKAVTQTGGNYLFSRTVPQVDAAVMTVLAQIKSRGIIEAREGTIGGRETLVVEVPVDAATEAADVDFLLTSSGLRNGLSLKLKDPSGASVAPLDLDAGLPEDARQGLSRYRVERPSVGVWKVFISNPALYPREYVFQAHSLAEGVTVAAYAEKDVVLASDPLVLKAAVTTDHPVAGAKVTARIEPPNGKPVTVELHDDGSLTNGDEKASDGSYSSVFKDYAGSGTYTVEVTASSEGGFTVSPSEEGEAFVSQPVEPFIRKARFSVVVQDAPEPAGER